MKKTVLGLDIGTNSIGWAVISSDFQEKEGAIIGMGSRIIPMSQDILGEFERGNSFSQTAERTRMRGARRLIERFLLRRERMHIVLNELGFLPIHYKEKIDFRIRRGKFINYLEPKIAWSDTGEFLFKDSFHEMLNDFRLRQPALLVDDTGTAKKVPYDWLIYYLRVKALTQKISKEELAWVLLQFNKKRGYKVSRTGEQDEKSSDNVEYYELKVIRVEADLPVKGKDELWYSVHLENGFIYRRSSKTDLSDWIGKTKALIVTTKCNADGTPKIDKDGNISRSFRAPGDEDWGLKKKKTESEIDKLGGTVGEYIYYNILKNPSQKIIGGLVSTIDRHHYRDEIRQIIQTQAEFHPELKDMSKLETCIDALYPLNTIHGRQLKTKTFTHLLIDDILFYQRPLKSKKSLISDCPLERRNYMVDGQLHSQPLKCAPKSHPAFQEFRLWQWISNLRILLSDGDKDVTHHFMVSNEQKAEIFNFLNDRKSIKEPDLIKFLLEKSGIPPKSIKAELSTYRWNYPSDKEYPCNETRHMILSKWRAGSGNSGTVPSHDMILSLWHIIYSVTDPNEYCRALSKFAVKNNLDETAFTEAFANVPAFKSDYAAYSIKAIHTLLPLLRCGRHWAWDSIPEKTRKRIENILTGEFDPGIRDRVREKSIHLSQNKDFQGLPMWLGSYIAYDRHSEARDISFWDNPDDIDNYLKAFRQHSLRNPIVEQVLTETLRVVRDIWRHYGKGEKGFFDEIHIELGRELKNNADERKKLTKSNQENENTNIRIKALLKEMMFDNAYENVRPFSPSQQEILKIYEEGALISSNDIPEDILKISRAAEPSKSELTRYKLWLEQKYRSPYTGQPIPLSRLFTPEYEIEHVIPQSRFFDDSMSNKVICEAAVNKLKDNQTGLEFIRNHGGQNVALGMGKSANIMSEEEYSLFVRENYSRNRSKKEKLMSEDIPEKMVERQLNDTRYVSKHIMQILSAIVRKTTGDEGVNSVQVVPFSGKITEALKRDWGMHGVWNDIILPRFERLNEMTNTTEFTSYSTQNGKWIPQVPDYLAKGFQKKRIDHRHHAMDALVIAAGTRNHVNYLNNQHALDKTKRNEPGDANKSDRFSLRNSICIKKISADNQGYSWEFAKPWPGFTEEAKEKLTSVIISFKQNIRAITSTTNLYWSYKDENGNIRRDRSGQPLKALTRQTKGDSWAIRKPLHKDTINGLVCLRMQKSVRLTDGIQNWQQLVDKELKHYIRDQIRQGFDAVKITAELKKDDYNFRGRNVNKVDIYYMDVDETGIPNHTASRTNLNTDFDEKKIASVTDTGIRKILLKHLDKYRDMTDDKGKAAAPHVLAFSPEGIEEMNANIRSLNDGKGHQPIYKVRTFETRGNKFNVGNSGIKNKKMVVAAKGTNLFFAIYADEDGKRSFDTIPFNIVLERLKQKLTPVPEENEKGHLLLFYLSPNDLVKIETSSDLNYNSESIYKMVSSTGNRAYFIPMSVSRAIYDKYEYSQLNKVEFSLSGENIKNVCFKIKVDRLGNIIH